MLYSYRCLTCKKVTDAARSIDNRNDCPACDCGGKTRKIISLYTVHSDMEPYYDPNLQTHIQGKQHRARGMKEQGVQASNCLANCSTDRLIRNFLCTLTIVTTLLLAGTGVYVVCIKLRWYNIINKKLKTIMIG